MNEINKINLLEQTKFRLREIIEIENYFHQEINQRKLWIKKLSKYVTVFDYIDKILIALSTATGGVSIVSFTSLVGASVGIASVIFTLIFSLTTGTIKKLLSIKRNKKKKLDKILMLAKSKLNIIETLVSKVLIDIEISQEEFNAIMKEKKLRGWNKMPGKKQENMRLNSVNSKNNEFVNTWLIKNYRTFYTIKKFYFIFSIHKMYLISA